MLVYRWHSRAVPDKEQIRMFFEREGFTPREEVYKKNEKVPEHIHPFDEVRMVCSGEIHFNIAGNNLLLRSGDKIVIPANTWHSKEVRGSSECVSLCAFKLY